MNNTGIVRKIDELGRIVIPKEIRNVLNIKSNDDLEIIVKDSIIMLKKFDKAKGIINIYNNISHIINDYTLMKLYITNREKIINTSTLFNLDINDMLKKCIEERKKYKSELNEKLIFSNQTIDGYFLILPIIIDSDVLGLLIFQKDNEISQNDETIATIILKIIENR